MYTITSDPVVLPNASYDQFQLTLGPGAGNRFVVDNVGVLTGTRIDLLWVNPPIGGGVPGVSYNVTYTNGTGNLPAAAGLEIFGLSNTGCCILAIESLTPVTGGFAFDAMTISNAFGPFDGGGTYTISGDELVFSYSLPGNVADPGRFTHIVPEPSTLVLAALAMLGFALYQWRRKR